MIRLMRLCYSVMVVLIVLVSGCSSPSKVVCLKKEILNSPDTTITSVIQSTDGGTVAYLATRNDKKLIGANGKYGKQYDDACTPVVSHDGETIAYMARIGPNWMVVVGDNESASFDSVMSPVVSPCGKHVAFSASRGRESFIVVDNMIVGKHEMTSFPEFCQGGKVVAYKAYDGGRWQVIYGDKESKKYDLVGAPSFASISHEVVFVALNNNRWRVVIGEQEFGNFLGIANLLVSSDGKHFAAAVRVEGDASNIGRPIAEKWAACVDGAMHNHYDQITEIKMSKDWKKKFYVAVNKDKYFVVAQGKEQRYYDEVRNLVVNSDDSRFAYFARRGPEWFVVTGKQEGRAYSQVDSLSFSPDGALVAYVANIGGKRDGYGKIEGGKLLVVIDNKETECFETVSNPIFIGNTSSQFFGYNNGVLYRITVNVNGAENAQ